MVCTYNKRLFGPEKETLTHATIQMNCKDMLSKINQHKALHDSCTWGVWRTAELLQTESQNSGYQRPCTDQRRNSCLADTAFQKGAGAGIPRGVHSSWTCWMPEHCVPKTSWKGEECCDAGGYAATCGAGSPYWRLPLPTSESLLPIEP